MNTTYNSSSWKAFCDVKKLFGKHIGSGCNGDVYEHKQNPDRVFKIIPEDGNKQDVYIYEQIFNQKQYKKYRPSLNKLYNIYNYEESYILEKEKIETEFKVTQQFYDDINIIIKNYQTLRDTFTNLNNVEFVEKCIKNLKSLNKWKTLPKNSSAYNIYKLLYIMFPFDDIGFIDKNHVWSHRYEKNLSSHNIGITKTGKYVLYDF